MDGSPPSAYDSRPSADGPPRWADESDLAFVIEFTRTRMTLDYQMTQGDQTVFYQARWVNTRGQTGRWSETASATIAA